MGEFGHVGALLFGEGRQIVDQRSAAGSGRVQVMGRGEKQSVSVRASF